MPGSGFAGVAWTLGSRGRAAAAVPGPCQNRSSARPSTAMAMSTRIRIATALLFGCIYGCGPKLNSMSITCPEKRTLLDGVCVSEAIADYVACVRAQGATLGAARSQQLSADVEAYGIKAGGTADLSETLERKYSVSDAAMLEIVRRCNTSAPPSCPQDSTWDGTYCVRNVVVTKVDCPAGTELMGAKCVPEIVTECPSEMTFTEGRGCVPKSGVEPTSTPTTRPPDASDVHRVVREFYERRGEFRGEYAMAVIHSLRLERVGDVLYDAHVSYEFECVRGAGNCCCGDQGTDQRVFTLQRLGGNWRVVQMGAHNSARF